ncbi:MAG TPA: ABC transporter permease [Gaiellaceae bacterium]|jgi:peptide/nickel transport system permease protein
MTRYVVKRLGAGVIVVFALTFVTFAVFRLIPYNAGHIIVGPTPTPAQLQAADHQLGVDQSLPVQYWHFLGRLAHGSLGRTFTGESLNGLMASTIPVTALLVAGGALLMLAIALPLAIASARHAGTAIDRGILVVSILGIALHPFVVAVILKDVFGTHLHFLPYGGYCPMHRAAKFHPPPGPPLPPFELAEAASGAHGGAGTCRGEPWPWLWFQHMVLPWVTFALFLLPFYVRILRTRLIENYNEPYVTVARAKGASERRILARHLLRIVFATTLAMLALDVGTAVTAAIYVESAYSVPGLGRLAVQALGSGGEQGYDLPTVAAIVLVVAVLVTVLSLLADLGAARLDPRITLGSSRRQH